MTSAVGCTAEYLAGEELRRHKQNTYALLSAIIHRFIFADDTRVTDMLTLLEKAYEGEWCILPSTDICSDAPANHRTILMRKTVEELHDEVRFQLHAFFYEAGKAGLSLIAARVAVDALTGGDPYVMRKYVKDIHDVVCPHHGRQLIGE